MRNRTTFFLVLYFLLVPLFFACKKENVNKEFGQYAVAVTYSGYSPLELHFVIDGKECGSLIPAPNVNPSYLNDCGVLTNPNELTNVFVLKGISPGDHAIDIKTSEGEVVKKLTFKMLDKECVFQDLDIAFN